MDGVPACPSPERTEYDEVLMSNIVHDNMGATIWYFQES